MPASLRSLLRLNPRAQPLFPGAQLRESFGTGLHVRRKDAERDGTSNLAETLFFYPLTGALNSLASQIAGTRQE